ncbi:MAG TPA: ABC transporter permease, partial [Rectinema sp.]|nr:ABC transporter permease [Rectinema sp.]HRS31760.1 ABC transporter permease [Rectinema sp.]
MTFEVFLQMFPIALMFSAPIILTALGGLFSERSGIVNIALEGIMMVGAFTGATITVLLENSTPAAAWIGLLGGLLSGVVFSLLHAVASINLKADQVISGTALNILAGGLTV